MTSPDEPREQPNWTGFFAALGALAALIVAVGMIIGFADARNWAGAGSVAAVVAVLAGGGIVAGRLQRRAERR